MLASKDRLQGDLLVKMARYAAVPDEAAHGGGVEPEIHWLERVDAGVLRPVAERFPARPEEPCVVVAASGAGTGGPPRHRLPGSPARAAATSSPYLRS